MFTTSATFKAGDPSNVPGINILYGIVTGPLINTLNAVTSMQVQSQSLQIVYRQLERFVFLGPGCQADGSVEGKGQEHCQPDVRQLAPFHLELRPRRDEGL